MDGMQNASNPVIGMIREADGFSDLACSQRNGTAFLTSEILSTTRGLGPRPY